MSLYTVREEVSDQQQLLADSSMSISLSVIMVWKAELRSTEVSEQLLCNHLEFWWRPFKAAGRLWLISSVVGWRTDAVTYCRSCCGLQSVGLHTLWGPPQSLHQAQRPSWGSLLSVHTSPHVPASRGWCCCRLAVELWLPRVFPSRNVEYVLCSIPRPKSSITLPQQYLNLLSQKAFLETFLNSVRSWRRRAEVRCILPGPCV